MRPGPITEAQISAVVGLPGEALTSDRPIEAPGQLETHYSPGKPVRLGAVTADTDEFHIGFDKIGGDWNLSDVGDLAQAAARLYTALHRGAAAAEPKIAVAPIPDDGIGAAINDRLRRAAA